MRILIVSQWFQPEPHFKGLDFAKALRDRGHDVEVLTGFPNYPGGKVYEGYRVRLVQREVLDGIPVTRGYLYPSHDRSPLRRIANYLSFATSTTFLALGLKRPDVVYVYTPPMTAVMPALTLRLLRGVPFVPDIQDLWPDTLAATGMMGDGLLLSLVGWFVRLSLRRAASVIVLSPGFRDRLRERGIGVPIHVIPNWAPPEIVEVAARISSPNSLPQTPDRPFQVLFAGNMGKAQGLETVLEAACILENEGTPVVFRLAGGGVQVAHLRDLVCNMNLTSVEILPPRHPNQMDELFDEADALLVHLVDDPLFRITVPSKTQAYLAIGKPILMGVEGNAADLVMNAGAGLAFKPESPQSLVDELKRLMAMPKGEQAAMGALGRAFYDRALAFEIGVDAIEKALLSAANRRAAGRAVVSIQPK